MTINHSTPLVFSALPFAKLAPSAFLTAHLSQSSGPVRPSGRTPSQTRLPTIHTGSLTHAHGSAVVRCGDTSVVCGVRGEILRADDIADWTPSEPPDQDEGDPGEKDGSEDDEDAEKTEDEPDRVQTSERAQKRRKLEKEDIARLNLLVPNVELATGCSPGNLPGGPPSAQAQVLAQRLLTLLHTVDIIPLSKLRIWNDPPLNAASSGLNVEAEEKMEEAEGEGTGKKEVRAFWVLYIDIWFMSLSGPPLDAAWLAMLAALKDMKLPHAVWDADKETVVCDPEPAAAVELGLRDLPVAFTCGAFVEEGASVVGKKERRKWILADVDGFEEGLCQEMMTVVVGRRGRLLRIEKGGGGAIGGKEVMAVVEVAERWGRQCIGLLKS